MGEIRRRKTGDATFPSPEGMLVARTERSPGFGLSLAFPVSQWQMSEDSRCFEICGAPIDEGTTARYSGGAAPVLHRLPSIRVRDEEQLSKTA